MSGWKLVLVTAGLWCIGGAALGASPATDRCARLHEIRSIPLSEGWPEIDPAYLTISANREAARTCLLDRIGDATPMRDPRSEPTKVDVFAVGDLAFFLLVDFKMLPFEQLLPPEVRRQLPERGVFAYFEWVGKPGNRGRLQRVARDWSKIHARD